MRYGSLGQSHVPLRATVDVPHEKQLQEGHKEIERAEALHPNTPKEQGFLTAAEAFYQGNSKLTTSSA